MRNGSANLDWIPRGQIAFEKCPNLKQHQSCWYNVTEDREELDRADAVIYKAFHVREDSYMPLQRNVNQTWIFYETESPFLTWDKFRWNNATIWDKMNMTITYAPGSDIVYGMYDVRCKRISDVSDSQNYAASKKNAALFLVSDCLSSGRMSYVKELQKHYPVEIFGKCGKGQICGHFLNDLECENDLMETYKFYLAFENSYCKNYYTEKAVKTMAIKTIPVVLGLQNYTEIIGGGTHVNARDFKSPKELAARLHTLSTDDDAYNEIMRKKMQMKCRKNKEWRAMLCELCEKLHNREGERNILPDMRNFWGVKENCLNPRDFFTGISESMGDFRMSSKYKMHGME
ncbi:hypothetical protein CAPTEDRAFT_101695 [Capitella teleta]|uniref:Fucosyltransferase n=1 Tax=Capitella teleta TaxID=283909 RepID=R7TXV3_CAPTE|nr:hypothetical protein CAPTEDRAFT_101695 [Capitella teleta]|eukprot:ELT95790.1 hypothetical protein CAPTEDRAFT_101695 [Capitella teleta]